MIRHLTLISVILLLSGCTPIPKESIDIRNAIVADAIQDSEVLSESVREQLLELFTLKSEAAYANLQSSTEAKLAASQSTQETVDIMNDFYLRREALNRVLIAESEAHASQVKGIKTLGYGIKTLNEMANAEADAANEPLLELAVSGFRTELLTILTQLEARYAPKAPEPKTVEPKVEESTE